MTNYHRVLGVSRHAGKDEIRKAYLALVRKWHPDHNKTKGAEEKFKSISEAYEVLRDDAKRLAHTFETGNKSSMEVWNTRQQFYKKNSHKKNGGNAKARQRARSASAASAWVDIIMHPYSLLLLIPALFAAQWLISPPQSKPVEQDEQQVSAWFNTKSQRWETPAPWDKNFQLQRPVIQKVARGLVHDSSMPVVGQASRP